MYFVIYGNAEYKDLFFLKFVDSDFKHLYLKPKTMLIPVMLDCLSINWYEVSNG